MLGGEWYEEQMTPDPIPCSTLEVNLNRNEIKKTKKVFPKIPRDKRAVIFRRVGVHTFG